MADEFEDISSRIPGFESVIKQRLVSKNTPLPPPGTVDPYQLMLKLKKQGESNTPLAPTVNWPEADVKQLQDYCNKMGIYGFSTKLNPLIVLAQLKKQFGDDYTGVPLEQRVPEGYERLGSSTPYNSNYPYSKSTQQKQILHG